MTRELQKLFVNNHQTLATAESCTGGNIAHQITRLSGSSAYFLGAVVSYANHVKKEALGVSSFNLENHGAVSEEVATEMVLGVKGLMKSTYAVSTTGIAGPSGAVEGKPVGTVWIAVSGPNNTMASRFQFKGSREEVINATTEKVIFLLSEMVKEDFQ